jgi:hypothetical protein
VIMFETVCDNVRDNFLVSNLIIISYVDSNSERKKIFHISTSVLY